MVPGETAHYGKQAACRFCEVWVPMRFGPFLAIAVLLFLLWIGGFVVFHVAGSLIHLLLLIAIVSLVVHFFTGSRTT